MERKREAHVVEKQVTGNQTSSACTLIALGVLETIHRSSGDITRSFNQLQQVSQYAQEIYDEYRLLQVASLDWTIRGGEHPSHRLGEKPTAEEVLNEAIRLKIIINRDLLSGLTVKDALSFLPDVWGKMKVSKKPKTTIGEVQKLNYSQETSRQELKDLIKTYFEYPDIRDQTMTQFIELGVWEEIGQFLLDENRTGAEGAITNILSSNHNGNNIAENNAALVNQLQNGSNFVAIFEGHTIAIGKKDNTYFAFDSNSGKIRYSEDPNALINSLQHLFHGEILLFPVTVTVAKEQKAERKFVGESVGSSTTSTYSNVAVSLPTPRPTQASVSPKKEKEVTIALAFASNKSFRIPASEINGKTVREVISILNRKFDLNIEELMRNNDQELLDENSIIDINKLNAQYPRLDYIEKTAPAPRKEIEIKEEKKAQPRVEEEIQPQKEILPKVQVIDIPVPTKVSKVVPIDQQSLLQKSSRVDEKREEKSKKLPAKKEPKKPINEESDDDLFIERRRRPQRSLVSRIFSSLAGCLFFCIPTTKNKDNDEVELTKRSDSRRQPPRK